MPASLLRGIRKRKAAVESESTFKRSSKGIVCFLFLVLLPCLTVQVVDIHDAIDHKKVARVTQASNLSTITATPSPTPLPIRISVPSSDAPSIASDGCGDHHDFSVQARYSSPNEQDKHWLHQVRTCTQRFHQADVKFGGRQKGAKNDMETLQLLQCDMGTNWNITKTTLLSYETVWFLGDSILAQQFYTFLCMVNPEIEVQRDMVHYHPTFEGSADDPVNAVYEHTSTATNKTTTFKFSRFGYRWGTRERNLYQLAFPEAIHTLTQKDAIVMDASSHYDGANIHLMEKALTHIQEQSKLAKASIFYMESSTEEWPTSNGNFFQHKPGIECRALVFPDQLEGHWDHSNISQIERQAHKPAPPLDFVEKYGLFWNKTILHPHYDQHKFPCYPNCLPADWRVTVARSILQGNSTVAIVPIWWQLAQKGSLTSVSADDCTHKSFEGITMMNQQLVRAMARRQKT